MQTLFQDLRFGVRMLRKNPAFTIIAVLSLGIGIGAAVAIFSLVNAILLGSLPVPHPQELSVIRWSGMEPKLGSITGTTVATGDPVTSGSRAPANAVSVRRTLADSFTYPQYRNLREQCAAQAEIFAYADTWFRNVNVRVRREPFIADGLMVGDNFFRGLGMRPLLGRLLETGDDNIGTAPIVVISYRWWEGQFGLDPGVLGQSVLLNGHPFTIVGVLPREFRGVGLADAKEFYVPMSAQPLLTPDWPTTSEDRWWVHLMARVKPGVPVAQLRAALDVVFAQQVEAVMKTPRIEISDGRAGLAYDAKEYRKPLLILLSVVGVVILAACANLAGLSLARGAARRHEFVVRAALGSNRWRLIRQLLTENLLLALLGGMLGLLLAFWGRTVVSRLLAGAPEGLRYDLLLDLRVLGFTLVMTFLTAVLSGLLPAWHAGRVHPAEGLKSRGSLGGPRLRTGRILVAAQIALSVLLVAGAGLYGRTLVNLVRINPGFKTERLLLFRLDPYKAGLEGPAIAQFYERVQDSLGKVPGVRSVALVEFALLGGSNNRGFFAVPAHPELAEGKPPEHYLSVSETFFTTMGIPMLSGRGFTTADAAGATKVVVINETFARNYFPNEYPVGQTIAQAGQDRQRGGEDWRIVGVCRDAKYTSIKADVPPTVYYSFRQRLPHVGYFAVRTALPPLALVPAAQKTVLAVHPDVPLADITTQEAVRDKSIGQERMFAMLVGALAGVAVLLACIGLFGLMAYNVARRGSEIGIRMALGATRAHVAWPILREALLLATAGLAVGVPAALVLTRLIESQLYGVALTDPVTLMGCGVLLIIVALVSAWIPARRAARIDPMVALRYE